MDFLPLPSRRTSRPPHPLDYRTSPGRTVDNQARELGLASFTLRLLGFMATIVGLLLTLLPMLGGIDESDALEWLLTRGITFMGLGIALLVLSVIVLRRWERRR